MFSKRFVFASFLIFASIAKVTYTGQKCGRMPKIDIQTIDLGNGVSEDQDLRKLSSSMIRLTYDSANLESNENKQYEKIIQTALDTAFNFYQQFVKVKLPVGDPFSVSRCSDYPMSTEQQEKKIKNSDMHFFVMALTDTTSNWIARAGSCLIQKSDGRPVVGIIQFNKKFLPSTGTSISNYQFNELIETTIHEMFHSLAFSSDLFKAYVGISSSVYSSTTKPWIAFPNVLAFVKNHFGCNSINQVQLEDDGGNGSAGSHWERTLFQNDIMTATEVAGDNTWSGINNALMQDTGWYQVDLSFHDRLFWGKNKGCDFFNFQCEANPKPAEFCDPTNSASQTTGFHFTGYCNCYKDPFTDNNCSYYYPYKKALVCQNSGNTSDKDAQSLINAGSLFGWNSKAVASSLRPTGMAAFNDPMISQCYLQKCVMNGSNKNIEFTIGKNNDKLICIAEGEELTLSGYDGKLICPNIQDFCERQYGCDQLCNQGGFCMNQKCYCTPGFSGASCECGLGTFYKNGSCQPCTSKNCSGCNEYDVCIKCNKEYELDDNNICVLSTFGSLLLIPIIMFILLQILLL